MSEYSFYESARNKIAFEAMQNKAEAEAKADLRVQQAEAKADLRVQQAEAKADLRVQQAEAKADLRVQQAEAKANLETAKKLIAMGLSSDIIKKATKLTDSQLASLEL